MNSITILDRENIPPALLEIPQPPKKLYLEGNLPAIDHKFLAVVGSRKCSSYGREVCETLIRELAGQPIVIVSGLALGIDGIAHESALATGLKTIAFPGSGLDRNVLYPASHRGLADRIVANGGCLISEYEPKARANPYFFPQRNRLMAGLSDATLVIEASEKSGTLITARMALDYNRDVLAVPGSIFSPASTGSNWLLRQGAAPIRSGRDIIESLRLPLDDTPTQQALFDNLTEDEAKIVNRLKIEPLERDLLLRAVGLNPVQGNIILMTMEIKGLIKETQGEIRLCR